MGDERGTEVAAHGVFHYLIVLAAAEQNADAGVLVRTLAAAVEPLPRGYFPLRSPSNLSLSDRKTQVHEAQQSRLNVGGISGLSGCGFRLSWPPRQKGYDVVLNSARETVQRRYNLMGELADLVSHHRVADVGLLLAPKVAFVA